MRTTIWNRVAGLSLLSVFAFGMYSLRFEDNAEADGCVRSDDAVQLLYKRLLGRVRDRPGSDGWVTSVDTDKTLKWAVRGIVLSPEWKGKNLTGKPANVTITTLYQQLLDRAPDATGLAGWTAILPSKGLDAVVDGILESTEYRNKYGDWGIPGGGYACTYPTQSCSISCGTLNPTTCSASCPSRTQHADCHCDTAIVSWQRCSCEPGARVPPPPPLPPRGGIVQDTACGDAAPVADAGCNLIAWTSGIEVQVYEENKCGRAGRRIGTYNLQKDLKQPVHSSNDRIHYEYRLDSSESFRSDTGAWCHHGDTLIVP